MEVFHIIYHLIFSTGVPEIEPGIFCMHARVYVLVYIPSISIVGISVEPNWINFTSELSRKNVWCIS